MENILNSLCCPSTGENLKISSERFDLHESVKIEFAKLGAPVDRFASWIVNESGTLAYPMIDKVLVLVPALAVRTESKTVRQREGEFLPLNPFRLNDTNDTHGYEDFGKLFTFKVRNFLELAPKDGSVIVEFMSSNAITLRQLPVKDGGSKIAVDLDYWALDSIPANTSEPAIFRICADATRNCFKPNTIDFALSNSIHHIPGHTNEFYSNIYSSLKPGSVFAGIESHGFFAWLALEIVKRFPKPLMPRVFKVIYEEKELLTSWLSRSIDERLAQANVTAYRAKKTLFHVVYSFKKSEPASF